MGIFWIQKKVNVGYGKALTEIQRKESFGLSEKVSFNGKDPLCLYIL